MEVNGRIHRSNWLSTYCGVNLPWMAYLDLVEEKRIEVRDYKKNVYWIELCTDIRNTLTKYDLDNLSWREYLAPYFAKDKTFADVSLKDLRPFVKRGNMFFIKHASRLAEFLNLKRREAQRATEI